MTIKADPDKAFSSILLALKKATNCPEQAFVNNLARRYPRPLVEEAYDLISSRWPSASRLLSQVTYARLAGQALTWDESQHACMSGEVKATIAQLGNAQASSRELLEDRDADVLIGPNGGRGKTVIVFSAVDGNVGLPPRVVDGILSLGGFTTIFVRDYSCCYYLRGVTSLGQNVPDTLTALRKILEKVGTKELYVMGHSSGAFGALRYGIELGANQITGFSAYTDLTEEFCQSYGEFRGLVIHRRVRLASSPDEQAIRPLLNRRSFSGRIDLYFGALNAGDCRQAECLDGLSCVSLHPLQDCSSHEAICAVAAEGQLLAAVEGSAFKDS